MLRLIEQASGDLHFDQYRAKLALCGESATNIVVFSGSYREASETPLTYSASLCMIERSIATARTATLPTGFLQSLEYGE